MREILESIRRQIRGEQTVIDYLGRDEDDEVKFYFGTAKTNAQAPYIIGQVIPGGDVLMTYGDGESVQEVPIQFSIWHPAENKAWLLYDVLENALQILDFDAQPWDYMGVTRTSFPSSLPDRDTPLWSVQVPFRFMYSRSGRTG